MNDIYALISKVSVCLDPARLSPAELESLKNELSRHAIEHVFLETIAHINPDPVFLKDAEGRYCWVNDAVGLWLKTGNASD